MNGLENEKKRINFTELSVKESGLNLMHNSNENEDKVKISEVEDPVRIRLNFMLWEYLKNITDKVLAEGLWKRLKNWQS